MSLRCPNRQDPSWRQLVKKIGYTSAMKEYLKLGDIPNPSDYDEFTKTPETLSELKQWFEDRFDGESFEVSKRLIDGKAFGQFYNGVVTLWENADLGVGYHEAFHKVSQLYLTPRQRQALYKEVRKKTGTILLPDGRRVSYNNQNDLVTEEILAEEFRNYMLNGQTRILGEPVRNSVFRKLWRMINNFLFGITDIQTVYETLSSKRGYTGKTKVNLPSRAKFNRVSFLNEGKTREMLEDFTAIFFDNMFETNKLTPSAFLQASDQKQIIKENYDRIHQIYVNELAEAESNKIAYSDDSYQPIIDALTAILDNFEEAKRAHYDYLVQYGIKIVSEEGKVNTVREATEEEVKEYVDDQETDEDGEGVDEEVGDDRSPYIASNEVNQVETLSTNTKLLIASLTKLEYQLGEATPVLSGMLRNKLVNFKDTYNQLAATLQGTTSPEEMWDRLVELAGPVNIDPDGPVPPNVNPSIQGLLKKLGHPSEIPNMDFDRMMLWDNFATDFAKTLSEGSTTIVNPDTGEIYQDANLRHNLRDKIKESWRTRLLTSKSTKLNKVTGSLELDKEVLKLNGVDLLKALGIEFEGYSDAEVADKLPSIFDKGLDMFIKNLKESLDKYDGPIDQIFNKGITTDKGVTSKGNFNDIADFIGERTKHTIELSYRNAEGKRIYGITQHNYLSLVADSINNAKTLDDVKKKHPKLVSLYNKNSLWFKELFEKDSNGKMVRTNNRIHLVTVSGLKPERDTGENTTTLHIVDKVTQEINDLFKQGGVSLPRASDKSTEYAIRVEKTPRYVDNVLIKGSDKLFITQDEGVDRAVDLLYNSFIDEVDRIRSRRESKIGGDIKEYGLPPEVKPSDEDKVRIKEIFKTDKVKATRFNNNVARYKAYEKYLEDNTIEDTPEALTYWWDTSSKSANFSIFEDILSKSTKLTLNPYLDKTSDIPQDVVELVKADTKKYLNSLVKHESKILTDFGVGKPVQLTDYVDGKKVTNNILYGIDKEISTNPSDIDNLLRTFILNHFIETVEHHKVIIGDTALHKDKFKRISSLTGNKDFMKGGVFTEWINNNIKFEEEYKDSDNMKVVVVKDVMKDSEMLKIYADAIGSGDRLGEYNGMTEADAQGLIDLIAYRRVSLKSKRWTNAQEKQYQYEMAWGRQDAGKTLTEIDKNIIAEYNQHGEFAVFPILKAQYAGPQAYDGDVNLQAFHKYSLAPIFPRLVKDTPLADKLQQMRDKQIGYIVFDSGSKVGTKTDVNGGQHDLFADKSFADEHIQTLHNQYLGIQVDIYPKAKTDVIYGTQFRKLIESNLFNNGEVQVEGFDKLHDEYKGLIDDLVKREWGKLKKELGYNEATGELNKEVLVKLIKAEAVSRNLADNTIESVDVKENGVEKVLKYQLDSLVNRNKIESLLLSIVNSRVIKQKMPGDGMIQVATTGFEHKSYDDKLLTYRKGENGETLPAQIKVSLNAQHKVLLDLYIDSAKGIYGDKALALLNADIKAGKIDKRILTQVGYRIPTQGMNSIEYMEIVEFLPPSTMNAIILPSEIVAKSGGDFDIDKLNIFRPNFKIAYKGETELSYAQKKVKLAEEAEGVKYDELDQDLFDEIVEWYYDQPQSTWPKDGLERIVLNASIGYQKYIKDKVNTVMYVPSDGKGKGSIQNRLIEIAAEVISNPYNFELLVTPNTVDTLKGAVAKIRDAKGISTSSASQTRQMEFSYIMDQFRYFLGGKNGVGPSAIHNTFHTLFQQAGTAINAEVYLPVNNVGDKVTLGATKAVDGRWISDTISQFINAYVDVAKDPFYKDLNAGGEAQGIYFYLLHMGVDVELLSYFLTQPSIIELTDAIDMNSNLMNKAYGLSKSRGAIVADVIKKYEDRLKDLKVKVKSDDTSWFKVIDDKDTLLKHMGRGFNKGELVSLDQIDDVEYLKDQLQAILNFEAYKKGGDELTTLTRTLNYDTNKPKDLAAIEEHKLLSNQVEQGEVFTKDIRQAILAKTVVGSFNIHDEIESIYTPLFITESKSFKRARAMMVNTLAPRTAQDKASLRILINNDFINYLTQKLYTERTGKHLHNAAGEALYQQIDRLFKGEDSVGRRLVKVKDIFEKRGEVNYLVEQLQPMLTQDLSEIDNISIFTKKYTVEDSNSLTASYRELLQDEDPFVVSFAKDLTKHGILQSGLNNSPITYLGLIPHEEYGGITEAAIQKFKALREDEAEIMYNDFFVRFILKNADKNIVAPYGRRKEGMFDVSQPGFVRTAKIKDGEYILWFNLENGWTPHFKIESLKNVRLNRYGYKLQDFYFSGLGNVGLNLIGGQSDVDTLSLPEPEVKPVTRDDVQGKISVRGPGIGIQGVKDQLRAKVTPPTMDSELKAAYESFTENKDFPQPYDVWIKTRQEAKDIVARYTAIDHEEGKKLLQPYKEIVQARWAEIKKLPHASKYDVQDVMKHLYEGLRGGLDINQALDSLEDIIKNCGGL